jgi:hypothetical protein
LLAKPSGPFFSDQISMDAAASMVKAPPVDVHIQTIGARPVSDLKTNPVARLTRRML